MAIIGTFGESQEERDYAARIKEMKEKLEVQKLSADEVKAIKAEIKQLQKQQEAIRQFYEAEVKKQGIVDESGKLIEAKDVQGQYVDRDYLKMRAEQGRQRESIALAEAQRQALAMRGTGQNLSAAMQLGAGEGARKTAQDQLSSDIRSETLRAKGEAGTELARKEAYASKLTQLERDQITTAVNNRMNELVSDGQISATLAQMAADELANADDDMLMKFIQVFGKSNAGFVKGLGSGMGIWGGILGGIGGAAEGVGEVTKKSQESRTKKQTQGLQQGYDIMASSRANADMQQNANIQPSQDTGILGMILNLFNKKEEEGVLTGDYNSGYKPVGYSSTLTGDYQSGWKPSGYEDTKSR